MDFKENQEVELRLLSPDAPADASGKPASIVGKITKLMKGHAIVCFTHIPDGIKLAVKESGDIAVLKESAKLKEDEIPLTRGDIEAVALSDLCPAEASQPKRKQYVTRLEANEFAKKHLGEYSQLLDHLISSGTFKQTVEGMISTADLEWLAAAVPTWDANIRAEQLRSGDEAKEFRRLAQKFLPGAF